jgi:hypothetical protein
MFSVPLYPEVIYRPALHGEEDAHGNAVCNEDADNSPATVCERVGDSSREDAKV